MTRESIDAEPRSLVAAIAETVREPIERSYHLHKLDGARMGAMISLDPG